jgi:hypothetical protein
VSEWQILVTVNAPHWDEDDQEWLVERIYNTVKQEVPKSDFTVQEFTK